MKNKKVRYFKLKFWPDKENRKTPEDRDTGENNENVVELLKLRNEYRLYYRNWIHVWRTYHYITRYLPALGILLGLLFQSYLAAGIVLLFWPAAWFFTKRKMKDLDTMAYLIPGLFDRDLEPHFGKQPPFTDDDN
jgi:hypothetical protein